MKTKHLISPILALFTTIAALNIAPVAARPFCEGDNPPPICDGGEEPTEPTAVQLNVPLRSQQTPMWCWAASGEMVMEYVDPSLDVTQCDQANNHFNLSNCCNNPTPTACINGGWQVFHHYGFNFTQRDLNALSWPELQSLISLGKPVMFAWAWNGGGGHMMVATGYTSSQGQRYVYINNPWPPGQGDTELITYENWVGGTGFDHTHWADFYSFQRQQSLRANSGIINLPMVIFNSQSTPLKLQELAPHSVNPIIRQEAVRSLEAVRRDVRSLATPKQLLDLGFKSVSEAESAVLARPIREYTVGLDRLRSFLTQQNPNALLTDNNTVLYPLVSNQKVESSIRVQQAGQKAKLVSVGNAALIKMIASLEGVDSELRTQSNEALVAVRIPALGLYFLSRQDGGVFKLASVFDVPALGLVKGQYEPAVNVFGRLAKMLSKMNGFPT